MRISLDGRQPGSAEREALPGASMRGRGWVPPTPLALASSSFSGSRAAGHGPPGSERCPEPYALHHDWTKSSKSTLQTIGPGEYASPPLVSSQRGAFSRCNAWSLRRAPAGPTPAVPLRGGGAEELPSNSCSTYTRRSVSTIEGHRSSCTEGAALERARTVGHGAGPPSNPRMQPPNADLAGRRPRPAPPSGNKMDRRLSQVVCS